VIPQGSGQDRGQPRALVIVPTYNERENLPVLVEELMRHPDVRVLIVDDQSPDGTGDVADGLARAHPGVIIVTIMDQNAPHPEWIAPDGHPNDLGHAYLAETFFAAIAPWLDRP
jgi:cellulose synthase/poly-beta-1,6-N-acetylglucosamine synthase-like glycosyltransferase